MFTRKPGFGLLSMARAWRLMAAILHSNQLAVSIPISYIYKMFYAPQFTHDMKRNERKLCVRIENEKIRSHYNVEADFVFWYRRAREGGGETAVYYRVWAGGSLTLQFLYI